MNAYTLKWYKSNEGSTTSHCGRFRIDPLYCGRTTAKGFALFDKLTNKTHRYHDQPQREAKAEALRIVQSEENNRRQSERQSERSKMFAAQDAKRKKTEEDEKDYIIRGILYDLETVGAEWLEQHNGTAYKVRELRKILNIDE